MFRRSLSSRVWPLLSHERGEGWALYLPWPTPRRPFAAVGWGFTGYQFRDGECRRFAHPYLHVGKAFVDRQPWWAFRLDHRVTFADRETRDRTGAHKHG